MKVLEGDYRDWQPLDVSTAVTIGVYDGIHLGHQRVLEALRSHGLPVVVVTFRNHPVSVIDPASAPKLLTTIDQRLAMLADLAVHATAVIDFDDEFRRLPAEEFVEKLLVTTLRAERVAVGRGFRFGHRQLGDITLLRDMGEVHGYEVDDVDILEAGVPVRSTVIRALLKEGHAIAAGRLLGRPYRLGGVVVPGDQRGRTIGFPTANLESLAGTVVPGSGVYAVWISIDEVVHRGVVNIGRRPTFGGTEYVVEAHVLDYERDLYGRTIELDFVERLRSEQKFNGVEELVAAIHKDVAAARLVLEDMHDTYPS
ncbi:MAG: bifunctional riboflavin kinase/FAD synthetase [bacterium]|nr:bifunctional riboflavin kinase/FAD synthetase [bacterium]MCP4967651.1 bifunctional riboflavin kinase/FAD synthetase [bacterium]